MAEALKHAYNTRFFESLTSTLSQVLSNFNKPLFLKEIHADPWDELELKQRMRRVSLTMRNHLDEDYEKSLNEIIQLIKMLTSSKRDDFGFEYMFFPDYIEVFGLENHLASIKAFKSVTQFTSCEFAVRPFIINHPELMYKQMMNWSEHKHPMVRRLASEGYRPRLPWAMALPELKKDPSPLLPMLEFLKNDESESVRRSVANNLNDISKDHPSLVIKLAEKWLGENDETDWLVKHASRTLLKQGNPELMELFGFGSISEIKIEKMHLVSTEVKIGEALEFKFNLENKATTEILIRLEYAIYFQKANGSLSKKVFSISEKSYREKSVSEITRKQPFKVISTRKLHKGHHQVALIINGHEQEKFDFHLH